MMRSAAHCHAAPLNSDAITPPQSLILPLTLPELESHLWEVANFLVLGLGALVPMTVPSGDALLRYWQAGQKEKRVKGG